MKLKYYLRGLGIGIFVTALIMGISLGGKKEMSDEEVVARAKELGMVESEAQEKNLQEMIPETEQEETIEESVQKETEKASENQTESESETQQDSVAESQSDDKTEATKQEESAAETERVSNEPVQEDGEEVIAGQVVSITIVSGDDSAVVSRKLEETGLVVSATSFDRYLCDNGYAKRLSTGTYEIAIGASEETIAKIITKSK